jgi:heptosyltransferase-2
MAPRPERALQLFGALTSAQVRLAARHLPAPTPRTLSSARSILVVRLDETIGDTVMHSAFLRELRRNAPTARIVLVVNEARLDLNARCPYVDRVVPTTLRCAATRDAIHRPWSAWRFMSEQFVEEAFDLAIATRVDYDHNSPFLVAASGAGCRVGFEERATPRKQTVARGTDALFTSVIAAPHTLHEVDLSLLLVEHLGGRVEDRSTELWLEPEAAERAREVAATAGLRDGQQVVILAPTGGHSDLKQWPIERYADLLDRLTESGRSVAVIGAPADRALVDELSVLSRSPFVDLVGKLRVPETAALIRDRASLFVGADSGMSHVAGAADVPTVAVFGPSSPARFGPRGPRVSILHRDLPCGPGRRSESTDRCATCIFERPLCMDVITADDAESAARRLGERA